MNQTGNALKIYRYCLKHETLKEVKMDKKKVKLRLKELNKFTKCKAKTQFICQCSDEAVHCLSELCFNLINGNIALKKKTLVKNLLPLRLILHFLADENESVKEKRKLLILNSEILFPILQKKVIPALRKQVQNRK